MNASPGHVYEFGDFHLDAAKRLLWRGAAPVPLTPRVFETLLYMVEHHDTVLDKERLMEAVWPDSIVEENNLTQNISTLRRVFGETPGSHHYIVTVPGRGYRFVADLKVISRSSVASYVAGPERNVREIGQELGVANVLEGSVRRAGGKVRVTAQLIEMRTNTHLWAETYDRDLADVFAIQSDIAQQIAAALEARLAPEEKARLDARPSTNSEAYVLYLTGLGREKAANSSTEDAIAAEQLFMQAAALDPRFALAYAAAPAIEKRVSDDPELAERHAQLGLLYAYMQRKEDAIRETRRAVEIEPESQDAFHGPLYAANLALVYALVGEPDQAITLIERLLSTPGPVQGLDFPQNITLADLRLRWEWDSLRSNPRFQKILAGPEPKTVY